MYKEKKNFWSKHVNEPGPKIGYLCVDSYRNIYLCHSAGYRSNLSTDHRCYGKYKKRSKPWKGRKRQYYSCIRRGDRKTREPGTHIKNKTWVTAVMLFIYLWLSVECCSIIYEITGLGELGGSLILFWDFTTLSQKAYGVQPSSHFTVSHSGSTKTLFIRAHFICKVGTIYFSFLCSTVSFKL